VLRHFIALKKKRQISARELIPGVCEPILCGRGHYSHITLTP